ncbi:MAG: 4a-hydroxytetrahydrobiopterin dehydratase [Catalinimonas sp.]
MKKTEAKSTMSNWEEIDGKLRRTFQFADFVEAFAFMTAVALVAEQLDHHPGWRNVYNRVDFFLSTHDAGDRPTQKDRELAERIDQLAAKWGAP